MEGVVRSAAGPICRAARSRATAPVPPVTARPAVRSDGDGARSTGVRAAAIASFLNGYRLTPTQVLTANPISIIRRFARAGCAGSPLNPGGCAAGTVFQVSEKHVTDTWRTVARGPRFMKSRGWRGGLWFGLDSAWPRTRRGDIVQCRAARVAFGRECRHAGEEHSTRLSRVMPTPRECETDHRLVVSAQPR